MPAISAKACWSSRIWAGAQVAPAAEAIRDRVARLNGVVAVGRADLTPATDPRTTDSVQLPGRTDLVSIGSYVVDAGFFSAMGVRTLAGRAFSEQVAGDDSTAAFGDDPPPGLGANVVLSATGATQLGFRSPQAAIGAQFRIDDVARDGRRRGRGRPVSLDARGDGADPLFDEPHRPRQPRRALFDGRAGRPRRARSSRLWRQQAPDVPFESVFVEDAVAEMYDADEARGYVFAAAALLAIVVGCLGLYALAAFTAERRTKEIGLRKVLGARTRDILRLLVWQFSKPVVIANLIAWPVAWLVMRGWLNGFQDRISLNPMLFVGAGPAGAGDRRGHHRRPCDARRPRQSDPRAAVRMRGPRPCGRAI